MIELPVEKLNVLGDGIGYVALTDVMGDDRTPARTARTSYRNAHAERSEEQDAKLTRYLITNRHTTPLQFVQLRFYKKQPILVARQAVRHRMQHINEISYRYVTAAKEYYVPQLERMQQKSDSNKQGSSEELVKNPAQCKAYIEHACDVAFDVYQKLLAEGLAPEIARSVLPVNTYTEWYEQWDMHNFLHMIKLRIDKHAQFEIRMYAEAQLELAAQAFPGIIATWKEINGL